MSIATFAGVLGQTTDLLDKAYRALSDTPSPMRLLILAHCVRLALIQGDDEAAQPYLDEARHITSQLTEADAEAEMQIRYAEAIQMFLAERTSARAEDSVVIFQDILNQCRQSAVPGDKHIVELFFAMSACFLADRETADDATQALIGEVERHRADLSYSWALWTRGLYELLHGDPDQTHKLARRALEIQLEIGDSWGPTFTVWLLACAAGELGAYERAARLLGGVRTLERIARISFAGLRPWGHVQEGIDRRVRRALGDDYVVAVTQGADMLPDQVMSIALEPIPDSERRPAGKATLPGGLTRQEFAIAGLVAEGLTSKQIGARLFISPKTADRHVVNIRAKLGLPNRVTLAAWHRAAVGGSR